MWFVSVSVILSVCCHVFCHHMHVISQRAIVIGSFLHRLHLPLAGMCSKGYCSCRVCLSVCLSLCLSASYLTSRTINRSTNDTTYSASDKGRKICGVSSETAAFESYTSEKSNVLIITGLPRVGPLSRTRSHSEGRVSTRACYLLL